MNLFTGFISLSFDTQINIVLSVLCFILSAISVITVILTLRQNSKMIEASTRPYISVFVIPGFLTQIVLKNYGSTGAEIIKLDCDADFSCCTIGNYTPFKNIQGLHLSPNEFITYEVKGEEFALYGRSHPIQIIISYRTDGGKSYSEKINLNYKPLENTLSSHVKIDDKNWKEHLVENLNSISETLLKK